MRRRLAPGEKPLFWIGSSKRDLLAMPDPVVRQMGAALSVAQYGGKHPDAKPWKGLGPERRLKAAQADYEARYGQASQKRQ